LAILELRQRGNEITNHIMGQHFDRVAIVAPGGTEDVILESQLMVDFGQGRWLLLDNKRGSNHRLSLAMLGQVLCKADANFPSIEIGDLLTASPNPGHVMKAADPAKAFGALIGKALS